MEEMVLNIRNEFRDMTKQKVWQKKSKSLLPQNCRCVKYKLALKIKHNGVYCTRLVNFFKNYSPIVNGITFCALLLIMIDFGFVAKMSMKKQPSCIGA